MNPIGARSGNATKGLRVGQGWDCLFGGSVNRRKYYLERVAYMKRLAREAQTQSLRDGCLKAAEQYQQMADQEGKVAAGDDDED